MGADNESSSPLKQPSKTPSKVYFFFLLRAPFAFACVLQPLQRLSGRDLPFL